MHLRSTNSIIKITLKKMEIFPECFVCFRWDLQKWKKQSFNLTTGTEGITQRHALSKRDIFFQHVHKLKHIVKTIRTTIALVTSWHDYNEVFNGQINKILFFKILTSSFECRSNYCMAVWPFTMIFTITGKDGCGGTWPLFC